MTPLHCTRCGLETAPTMRICPQCGHRSFAPAAQPQPVTTPAMQIRPAPTARSAPTGAPVPLHQARLLSRPAIALILGLTLLVFAFIGLGGDVIADMAVSVTPVKADREVTEQSAEYQSAIKASLGEDHPLARKVSAMGERLLQAIPGGTVHSYNFHVVPDRVINAYAFPGGEIFIHAGLIKLMTEDEQIAAVLAHEIQHVEQRHYRHGAYRQVSRTVLFSIILGIFGDDTADALAGFSILSHSRAQESEADLRGLKLLNAAGLPRSAMVDMLKLLAAQGDGGISWLSTHPDSRERARAAAREPLP